MNLFFVRIFMIFLYFDGNVIRGYVNVLRMVFVMCFIYENINLIFVKWNEGKVIKSNWVYYKYL